MSSCYCLPRTGDKLNWHLTSSAIRFWNNKRVQTAMLLNARWIIKKPEGIHHSQILTDGYTSLSIDNTIREYFDADIDRILSCKTETRAAYHIPLSNAKLRFALDWIKSCELVNSLIFSCYNHTSIVLESCQLFIAKKEFVQRTAQNVPSSYFWHRDSVGHSIKVWIPLYTGIDSPFTQYIMGSHILDPYPREWEMIRALPNRLDACRVVSAILESSCKNQVTTNQQIINSVSNCYIFDTNGVHRGIYDSEFVTTPDISTRIVLQYQFTGLDAQSLYKGVS